MIQDAYDVLDEMSDEEYIRLWNEFAELNGRPLVYQMDEIEDILMRQMGMSLLSIISAVDDKFYSDDEYFSIDDVDYIVSYSDLNETTCPISRYELAEYVEELGWA